MIKNYFITALRNFWRNKVFSVINVLGLSIGISAALIIFLIVHYEMSYDKFEKDHDRIFRVTMDVKFNGDPGTSAAVPAPLGNAIRNEVTGVDLSVPLFQFQGDATAKVTIAKNDGTTPSIYKYQPDVIFTTGDYFKLLSFQWLAGSQQAALQNPFSVVISESRAKQYFPSLNAADIIGKQIAYNDSLKTTVTGIVKDLTENTYFSALEFISLPTVYATGLKHNFMMETWNDWMGYSQLVVKLSAGTTPEKIDPQLKGLVKKYNEPASKDPNNSMQFKLQPLKNIHFDSNYQGVNQRTASMKMLYGLMAIALFLLLLACINFINLTTAQASHRAKEIGIRKTMGSSRRQLIMQFLGETLFITSIATIASIIIAPLLLKAFAAFIPEGLHFSLIHQPVLILFLVTLTFAVSIIAGFYPSIVLSSYKPVAVLKNQSAANATKTRNAWLRKTLTVSQFVIAQFFVIATFMVGKQIHYSLHEDLGFRKDAILTFRVPFDTSMSRRYALMNKIKTIPEIQLSSLGFLSPAIEGAAFNDMTYTDGKKEVKENVQIRWADTNYMKIYQLKLVAGRNVQQSDTIQEFVINETFAKTLGFQNPQDALNKQLLDNKKKIPIVGVLKDFHEGSMHAAIGPLAFTSFNKRSYNIHVLLKPENGDGMVWKNAISKLQTSFKEIYPDDDFNYSFFDENIAKFYETEKRVSGLLNWATGLTVLISCLGLLGLVIFITTVRTKEIGIRKVLGASVSNIVSILSKEFILLIVIAFVIATPIAWWAVHQWLQDFAYRTTMSWWVFAVCGLIMLAVAMLTLSIQTIKAAISNPVNALRSE
ncbi:MAG: ABC transporter permease [Bacteroidetes bacterium]|nr:ABC transporter permease [Bacteroidota bacterium]